MYCFFVAGVWYLRLRPLLNHISTIECGLEERLMDNSIRLLRSLYGAAIVIHAFHDAGN